MSTLRDQLVITRINTMRRRLAEATARRKAEARPPCDCAICRSGLARGGALSLSDVLRVVADSQADAVSVPAGPDKPQTH